MSKIKCNVIETVDGVHSVNVEDIATTVTEMLGIDKKQLATAWVLFDGTDGSIKSSFNVSGITRSGVGDYTITFEVPMDNVNFTMSGDTGSTSSSATAGGGIVRAGNATLDEQRFYVRSLGDAYADRTLVSVVFHGGKN